jgi:hypothetical protein
MTMALINLRNALMTGKRLPYDAEVEWLESDKNQHIDTGVLAASDIEFDAWFSADEYSGSFFPIFGAYSDKGYLGFQRNSGGSPYSVLGWRGSSAKRTISGSNAANYEGAVSLRNDKFTFREFSLTISTSAFAGSASLWYGRVNGFTNYGGARRIGVCKIWKSGVLVRDYIPVRKGTVGYLYDRVSGKLFGNAGTGDFVLGPDVVPVEYIESHGTEWIDTGVGLSPDIGLRIDFQFADVTREQILFGALEAGVARFYPVWRGLSELYWSNAKNGSLGGQYGRTDSNRHIITNNYLNDKEATIDGVVKGTNIVTVEGTSLVTNYLFARHYNNAGYICSAKVFQCQVSAGTNVVRDFFPIRVGTEGAMMDVLTRRIYRNAGTGAFAYGNDLKYPIPA